ncbi:MAG: hypothetical protein QM656_03375 [Paracoccaceae bacterium]
MSITVTMQVRERRVGSPTKKAVLIRMADSASDDGTGIWISKSRMADELEMGRRTVQDAVVALLNDGLIVETGTRSRSNGYTVEYRINMKALAALELVRPPEPVPEEPEELPQETTCAGAAHVRQPHMPCAGAAQQSVREPHINRQTTVLKPPPLAVADDFDLDRFIAELATAVGIGGPVPRSWDGSRGRRHIAGWLERLTPSEVLDRAAASRRQHPEPPATPQALDGFMVNPIAAKAQPRAGKAEVLRWKAELVNGDGFIPPSLIGASDPAAMVAAGLVTVERLAARGIR